MSSKLASRRVREKKAQRETNAWYDSRFPDTRLTVNVRGRKGWPDEIYFIPGGSPVLIEFKAEGEEPRKLQSYIHSQLIKGSYDVQVHTKSSEAIRALKERISAADRKAGQKVGSTPKLAASSKTNRSRALDA